MADGPILTLGRYALFGEIASGGMATVHLGRLMGPVGFSRTVAIKRLHPQFAKDPDFVTMFMDEARVAARIQHPNVVSTFDVLNQDGEIFLVMDYIEGESLARLIRITRAKNQRIPPPLVAAIISGSLYGLHAAHEAKGERGEPLHIVHRDISPQNILVGIDGVPRVLDFGVAKAVGRLQTTREGQLKGKLAYMPPEQIMGEVDVDRRVDIYAAGVCMWEALAGRRLFDGENEATIMTKILSSQIAPPSTFVPNLSRRVDEVVMQALSRDREQRFRSAWEMAVAVEDALTPEPPRLVGAFLSRHASDSIEKRALRVRQLESMSTSPDGYAPTPVPSLPVTAGRAVVVGGTPILQVPHIMWGLIFLGLATSAVVLLFVYMSPPTGPRGRVPIITGTAVAVAPLPSVSAAVSSAPSSTASGLPSSSAAATASATSATSVVGRPPQQVIVPTTTKPTSSTKGPAKVSCEPPYVVVAGKRVLKPECIQ